MGDACLITCFFFDSEIVGAGASFFFFFSCEGFLYFLNEVSGGSLCDMCAIRVSITSVNLHVL